MRIVPFALAGVLVFSLPTFAEHDDHGDHVDREYSRLLPCKGHASITAIRTNITKDGIFRIIMGTPTIHMLTAGIG